MLTLIEGGLDYIHQRVLHDEPETVMHHHGELDHLAYLERPSQEAIAVIHKRMHKRHIPH